MGLLLSDKYDNHKPPSKSVQQ